MIVIFSERLTTATSYYTRPPTSAYPEHKNIIIMINDKPRQCVILEALYDYMTMTAHLGYCLFLYYNKNTHRVIAERNAGERRGAVFVCSQIL